MYRKIILFISVILCLLFCHNAGADLYDGLVAYYPFTGDATDASGNGNDGELRGNPQFVEGQATLGQALDLDGSGDFVFTGKSASDLGIDGNKARTVSAWVYTRSFGNGAIFDVGNRSDAQDFCLRTLDNEQNRWRIQYWGGDYDFTYDTANKWVHFMHVHDGSHTRIYADGVLIVDWDKTINTPDDNPFQIGCYGWQESYFDGLIDEVTVYDRALTTEDARALILGLANQNLARWPEPASGATDVRWDPTLQWGAGDGAVAHDVYFGTNMNDVSLATRTDPRNVLALEGLSEAQFAPGKMAINTTYYWRIDEVSGDGTIAPGPVWSFTTEEVAVEVTNITATASTSNVGTDGVVQGPENTVNGSGLNNGRHDVDINHMWLNAKDETSGAWISFAFDKPLLLHAMHVWNHNTLYEQIVGFGIKDALIEYSLDNQTWTEFATLQLDQASSTSAYEGQEIPMPGVFAQYVRISALSNWSLAPTFTQFGLSEVRFSAIPVRAREPVPAAGETSDGLDVALKWRPGRDVAEHRVSLAQDANAVVNGSAVLATVDVPTLTTTTLELGKVYFWQVDEINNLNTPSIFPGSLWNFLSPDTLLVDDFESYDDFEPNRIFDTWIDGYQIDDNGSQVGYLEAPFTEQSIVLGDQSMPLKYDNTGSAIVSQTTRTFDPLQDWTVGHPEAIRLYYQGRPPAYLKDANGVITMGAAGSDIWGIADEFRYAYQTLSGDGSIVARVDSLMQTSDWAKAGVMIRESLIPEAVNISAIISAVNGAQMQNRSTAYSDTTSSNMTDEERAVRIPAWVKLERIGNQFNAYFATDEAGTQWVGINGNPITLNMPTNVYIGLAVTSHNSGTNTVATFSNVATTGGVAGDVIVKAIGGTHPSNDGQPMYVTITDSTDTQVTTELGANATLAADWREVSIPVSELSGLDLTQIKSMTIGIGDPGASQASDAEGFIFVDNVGLVRDYEVYDLLGYYPLDGDVLDASGNGKDGTINGTPVFIAGAIGQGLQFDGTGDEYVDLGTWNPSGPAEEMTIAVWAKWNGLNSEYQGLVGKRNDWNTNDMMWDIEIDRDSGNLYTHRDGGQNIGVGRIPKNEWIHLAFTYAHANVQCYVNGELIGQGRFTFGPTKDAALVFGCCQRGGGNPFNGALDDLRIYGRQLSADEVRALSTLE